MNGVQVPLTVDMRDYSCVVGNGEGWMNIVFLFYAECNDCNGSSSSSNKVLSRYYLMMVMMIDDD